MSRWHGEGCRCKDCVVRSVLFDRREPEPRRRVFRLKDGMELEASRGGPEAFVVWTGTELGSGSHEVTVQWPDEATGKNEFAAGWAFGGNSFRECFRQLRAEIREKGRPTARIEKGRLVLGSTENRS